MDCCARHEHEDVVNLVRCCLWFKQGQQRKLSSPPSACSEFLSDAHQNFFATLTPNGTLKLVSPRLATSQCWGRR